MDRRKALQRLTSITVAPLLIHIDSPLSAAQNGHTHPPAPSIGTAEDWVPLFLNENQIEAVAALAERIIPETDTLGAAAALAHQHIDYELSRREIVEQRRFLKGLEGLEGRSRRLFHAEFVALTEKQQIEILTGLVNSEQAIEPGWTEKDFFLQVKSLTIRAYYSSEIGLMQELGYRGNTFSSEFPGCRHLPHLNSGK